MTSFMCGADIRQPGQLIVVPIPNTNIASNIGPQIDPKDIDFLEAQRGCYSSR
jgi:hypothetical protein